MDLVAAVSGFLAAGAFIVMMELLVLALIGGAVIASFFAAIFYGTSRLAVVAERAHAIRRRP